MKIERLVIATRNRGKLHEFRDLLYRTRWEIVSLEDIGIRDECRETGRSFVENARIKALHFSQRTNLPVLADDSGLEVIALNGRPGIQSARYAGPGAGDATRIAKLLQELQLAQPGMRDARFVCALVLAQALVVHLEVEGECRGVIADAPRGAHGFGYDPVFLFPGLGRTYAELSPEEKNQCSHRSHAVRLLLVKLGLNSPK